MAQEIKVGDDVTSLINNPVQSGDDVTSLMNEPSLGDKLVKEESLWEKANKPLLSLSPQTNDAMDAFSKEHPVIGGGMQFITNAAMGLTSPFSVGLTALSGGAGLAEKAGLAKLADLLEVPSKVASGSMIAHGSSKVLSEPTLGGKLSGLLEGGLGYLGLKGGPKESPKLESIKPKISEDIPLVAPESTLKEAPVEPLGKLIQAIKDQIPNRELQDKLYSGERSSRIAKVRAIQTPGLPGLYQKLGALKGELPKVNVQPIKLEEADAAALLSAINNHPGLTDFEKIRASTGLAKILGESGEAGVPQKGQLDLLGRVFGQELPSSIMEMHGGLGGPVSKKILNETANLTKSIMTSADLSAPLRQGLPLVHKKEYWGALDDMVSYAFSQKNFDIAQKALKQRPLFDYGSKSGLHLGGINDVIENREEAFMSQLADKIPTVKGSERAYVGFLNKLRSDTFDNLVKTAEANGAKLTPELGTDLARFVNVATGRGSLGRFEKNAVELNSILFSPRLISSRLTMLNPKYYIDPNISPIARKEALKSLFATAGATTTIAGLGKLAGANLSDDPTNTDFGKIKIGNTRIDPYAGFQQYIVAAAKLINGSSTSSVSGKNTPFNSSFNSPSRWSVIDNLRRSKMSPIASFAEDLLRGTTADGKPVNISREVADRFVPMVVNDIIGLYQEDPKLLGLAPLAIGGMGTQSYDAKSIGELAFPSAKTGGLKSLSSIKSTSGQTLKTLQ